MRRCRTVLAATAMTLPLLGGAAQGAPVLRVAAGPNAAALTTAVAQFRDDLGGVDNGDGGAFATGRRQITWDDVPDAQAEPNPLPFNYYNDVKPRGVVFESTANIGGQHQFRVSADASNPTSTAVRFGNLDPTYSTIFQTFSGERLFAPRFSNTIDVYFFVPGTSIPATVSGFGAVFADVDGSTSFIEFYGADGKKLSGNSLNVANNGLSFIGTSYNAGERIARVEMVLGRNPLQAGNVDGTNNVDVVALDDFIYGEPQADPSVFRFADAKVTAGEGGSATVSVVRAGRGPASVTLSAAGGTATAGRDYTPPPAPVVLSFADGEAVKTVTIPLAKDDAIEGDETVGLTLTDPVRGTLADPSQATLTILDRTPPAPVTATGPVTVVPGPALPADRTAPRLVLAKVAKTMTRAAFLRGVTIDVTPSEASALTAELVGRTGRATLASAGDLTLASKSLGRASGKRTIRLRPSAKLVAHAKRRFTATLRITATDAAGNRGVATKKITVRAS